MILKQVRLYCTPIVIVMFFLHSCGQAQSETVRISARQQQLENYLNNFETDLLAAEDSTEREKIHEDWWRKHMIYIQDSLMFKSYPNNPDTFYFEKVIIKHTSRGSRKMLEVMLINENYYSVSYYDVTNNDLSTDSFYQKYLSLNENVPVLAEINLMDIFLGDKYNKESSEVFVLKLIINSIKNVKED